MNFLKVKSRPKAGFTLLELLVVIAIIGVLAGVILGSLDYARARSRDTKRLEDMRQLHIALSLYFNEFGEYPTASGYTGHGGFPDPRSCNGTFEQALQPLVDAGYMPEIPVDPINVESSNGRFCYHYYQNSRCDDDSDEGTVRRPYVLRFWMEVINLEPSTDLVRWYDQEDHWCSLPTL